MRSDTFQTPISIREMHGWIDVIDKNYWSLLMVETREDDDKMVSIYFITLHLN